MKFVICFVVLLPIIMAAPQLNERLLINLPIDIVKDALVATLGTDVTHDECMSACPGILSAHGLGALPFLCNQTCDYITHSG